MIKSILLVSVALLAGCSSIGCKIESSIIDGVAPMIVSGLQCSNYAAIKADLEKVIGNIGLCKKADMKGIPGPICQMIADMVVNSVAKVSIPASWGCSSSNAKDMLSALIVQGCKAI